MTAFFRIITIGLVVLLLAGFLSVTGCVKSQGQKTGGIPSTTGPTAAEKTVQPAGIPAAKEVAVVPGGSVKTCTGLGGTVTSAGQTCPGTYLTASDTFSCCSAKPAAGASPAAVLTIEPFTVSVENEDLGGISG
jgi:hypothetical protein